MPSTIVACFLLLLLLAPAIAASAAVVAACNEPFLPTDLDFFRTVHGSSSKEVHVHGLYRVGHDPYIADKSAMERNLTLQFDADTVFRASVAPDDAVFMELMLHRVDPATHATSMIDCSKGQKTRRFERMVAAALDAHTKYILVFKYSLGFEAAVKCPKVLVEIAAQAKQNVPSFKESCVDDSEAPALTPDGSPIEPLADQKYYYAFRTESPSWASLTPPDYGSDDVAMTSTTASRAPTLRPFAHPYAIRVPYVAGRHQRWKLRVQLHANFLDGGDLAAMVTIGNQTVAPSIDQCINGHEKCLYGSRAVKNTFILQQVLSAGPGPTAGNYTLWLVLRRMSDTLSLECVPYGLTVDLFPMQEAESFITCPADPFPATFHKPGLYNDATGVLHYTADVLINVSKSSQIALLKPSKPKSIARFWISNHPELDLDLAVYQLVDAAGGATNDDDNSGNSGEGGRPLYDPVAMSIHSAGPEGVVVELDGGKAYYVELLVASRTRSIINDADRDFYQFCDSVEFMAHVFPLVIPPSSTDTCTEISPVLDGVQAILNRSHDVLFGLPSTRSLPYAFSIDRNAIIDQSTMMKWDFYVPQTMFLNILAAADNYGGRPEVELTIRGDGRETLYGSSRAFGNGLHAVIGRGWYTLKIVTPFVQFSTRKWKDMVPDVPSCLRYNLWLNIAAQDLCVDALPLPQELIVSSDRRHHFIDTFALMKEDGTVDLEDHDMVLDTLDADSMLHVAVSDSAVPVVVWLYEYNYQTKTQGAMIVLGASHLGKDTQEIFEPVFKGKSYVVHFSFARDKSRRAKAQQENTPRDETETDESSASTEASGNDEGPSDGEEGSVNEATTTHEVVHRARLCETLRLQFSLQPMSVAALPTLGGKTVHCHDMSGQLDLSAGGPLPLPYSTDAVRSYRQNPEVTMQVTFAIAEAAIARGVLDYDFTSTSLQAYVCPGTDVNVVDFDAMDQGCVTGDLGYNGMELTTQTMQPGTYTMVFVPWPSVVSDAATGLTNFTGTRCQLVHLHLEIVAQASTQQGPLLCPAYAQHMPHSLNVVGRLSPYYGDETHMLQHVRVNAQHLSDATTFLLSRRSQVRLLVPAAVDNLNVRYSILGASGPVSMVAHPGDGVLIELAPGQYAVGIAFQGMSTVSTADGRSTYQTAVPIDVGACQTVPLEISVLPIEHVTDFGAADASCDAGAPAFPTTMFHHGHETMYRRLRDASAAANSVFAFDKVINFTVGDLGGDLDVAVMYASQSNPLALTLVGQAVGDDGKTNTKSLQFSFHRGFAFFNGQLEPGHYSFRLRDPVVSPQYQAATKTVSCAPYVLHLRFANFGSRMTDPPLAPGQTNARGGAATNAPGARPSTVCQDHLDVWQGMIRRSVVGRSSDPDSWFTYHGRAFRIPFETAEELPSMGNDANAPTLYRVTRTAFFVARASDFVRVWARSEFRGVMSVAVFLGNSSIPLKGGAFWGWHSQTIGFRPSLTTASAILRVDVVLTFRRAPVLGEDYTDCAGKRAKSTFELMVSALPTSRIDELQTCPDAPSAATSAEASIDVDSENRAASGSGAVDAATSSVTALPHSISFQSTAFALHGVYALHPKDFATTYLQNSDISDSPIGRRTEPPSSGPNAPTTRPRRGNFGNFFSSRVDAQRNVSLVVPAGTQKARMSVTVRFNMLIANMRLRLLSAATGLAIAHSETMPASDRDEQFNAMTTIEATNLAPGSYQLALLESNVEGTTTLGKAYCVTFDFSIFYSASRYPNGATDAPTGSQRIISIQPVGVTTLDVSDPFVVTVKFDRPVPHPDIPKGDYLVVAQQWTNATLSPELQYFESATVYKAVFPPFSFDWYTDYTLVVNVDALNANHRNHVSSSLRTAVRFSTALCGCDDGYCAVGGMCQCTEPSGTRCSVCAPGGVLTTDKQGVGPAQGYVCEAADDSSILAPSFAPGPTGPSVPRRNSPSPNSPPTTVAPAGNATRRHPPLRFLRILLSYAAVGIMGLWAFVTLARHRSQIAHDARNFHNPFRRIATTEEEADDEHDRPVDNQPAAGAHDEHHDDSAA